MKKFPSLEKFYTHAVTDVTNIRYALFSLPVELLDIGLFVGPLYSQGLGVVLLLKFKLKKLNLCFLLVFFCPIMGFQVVLLVFFVLGLFGLPGLPLPTSSFLVPVSLPLTFVPTCWWCPPHIFNMSMSLMPGIWQRPGTTATAPETKRDNSTKDLIDRLWRDWWYLNLKGDTLHWRVLIASVQEYLQLNSQLDARYPFKAKKPSKIQEIVRSSSNVSFHLRNDLSCQMAPLGAFDIRSIHPNN